MDKLPFFFFLSILITLSPSCKTKNENIQIQIRDPLIYEILGERLIVLPSPLQTPSPCIAGGIDIKNKQEMINSLDKLKSAGFDVIRIDFFWEDLEPQEGKIDEDKLQEYKDFVIESTKRNIEIMAIVAYGNWWASESAKSCYETCLKNNAQSNVCKSACAKIIPDAQKYGKFAGFLAQNFPSVNMFEIWNEPNWVVFLQPNPSPEAYADIFLSAHSNIKKYDQKKKVILGGLLMSETTNIPNSLLYIWHEFLGKLREKGVLSLADAVAFHPYIGQKSIPYPPLLPPEDSENSAGSLIYYISSLKRALKSFTSEEKPIYITEIGWPANYSEETGKTYVSGSQMFISEETQANFIIRAFAISAMLGIEIFCIYTLKDMPYDSQPFHDAEKFFGILKADSTPKKSYEAVKFTIPKIKGKYIGDIKTEIINENKNEEKIDSNNNNNNNKSSDDMNLVFSPAFEGEDKNLRALFWLVGPAGTEKKEKVKVKVYIPENSNIFSIYGEKITNYEKGKGYIILEISSSPIIAEIK